MDILTIDNLSKSFGTQKIISHLNFAVPEGAVFGLIGQNGAGKTTTMKMVLGLLEADSGSISVCGETVHYGDTQTNRNIGYLPDVPEFYNYMTAFEYLGICGEISGLQKPETKKRSDELLALVGLDGTKKRIGGYSRGMKQRLGIAQALLSRPKLLICDEPTSALDPVGRKEILEILSKIKGSTTVIFSTHILSDVERICDHVAVLHAGKIAISGTLAEIKATHNKNKLRLEFAVESDLRKFMEADGIPENTEVSGNSLIIQADNIASMERFIIETLYHKKLCPITLEIAESSLEHLFLEVVS